MTLRGWPCWRRHIAPASGEKVLLPEQGIRLPESIPYHSMINNIGMMLDGVSFQ